MKVTEKNNWEHRTYFCDDGQLTPENAQFVWVHWPNDEHEKLPVNWAEETHHYSDHGHPGSATSMVPYVHTNANGIPVRLKLTKLNIQSFQDIA